MRAWIDIAIKQQSAKETRSRLLAARAARVRVQLHAHDRRSVSGEAARQVERERKRPDACARAVCSFLDSHSAAPIDCRSPPLAAPRCGRTLTISRKRPAHMGAHIPAQIEHENIIDARDEGSVQASSATKVGNARQRGWRGASRAPYDCAAWPNCPECASSRAEATKRKIDGLLLAEPLEHRACDIRFGLVLMSDWRDSERSKANSALFIAVTCTPRMQQRL